MKKLEIKYWQKLMQQNNGKLLNGVRGNDYNILDSIPAITKGNVL